MAGSIARKCNQLRKNIRKAERPIRYANFGMDDEMATRGVRVWRRTDVTLPPSFLIEHCRNETCLLFENNASLEISRPQFEDWKQGYLKISDSYGLIGILRTKEESYLLTVKGVLSAGQLHNSDIYKITMTEFIPLRAIGLAENIDLRIPELQKLISSGMFYFSSSPDYDLTLCAQKRSENAESDERFFWNRSLHFPLQRFGIDSKQWFLKCISGSVLVRTVYVGAKTGKVALLSRLSCERVGTRFNVRGANDMGHVANFVETEQLILFDNQESSFVQIRGSIPLFWDQPGLQVGSHKVKLRAFEASAPAYKRHFLSLEKNYKDIVVVSLLGHKEGERTMTDAFKTQHKKTKLLDTVPFIEFDYHARMKASRENINYLKKDLQRYVDQHGFFHCVDGKVLRTQSGVVRTNCLDCLDRTNSVQTVLGIQSVGNQVTAMRIESANVNMQQRFEETLKDVWVRNGDQCSIIYAGTGALEGKSKLKDASRSITRTLQNNFMDHSKQESFDLFLCGTSFENHLFDRAANLLPHTLMQEYPDAVEQLVDRSSEITNPEPIKVFCGTWNVNGGKNMYNVAFRNQERIGDWLFPHESDLVNICSDLESVPDIVAVGLEELVDLNAQNMVKASTTNQRVWLEGIRKALHEKAPYVLLGCEQLMGVCLYVFIRPRLAAALKDFSVGSVKTGMGGATANKGSVAFRMVVHSTSLCFVCSHFAAGQNEIRDRNEDWSTAMRKLRFPQGRDIGSSDVIFWFGDFNYRISMGREDVKRAVASGQFDHLVPNDQLTQQRAASNTFVGFEEGPLHFPPTYKYDTFSDDYDTSEKCRVPAWTDRVLWRDNRGTRASTKLLRYNRSELRTSDHRPVYASFEVTTLRVDWTKCETLVEDIVSSMGPPDGTVICSLEGLGSFPGEAVKEVLQRTRELGLQLLTSKVDGADLWLVFSSGECAIAALSMDGIALRGCQLNVRLRTPDWPDKVRPRLAQFDVTVEQLVEENEADYREASNEFIFDEEEDGASDTISVSRLSMLSTGPPERPRPPSRGPPERPQRPASVVNPNIHVSSSAVQLATLDWPDDDSASSYSALSSSCPQRKLPHQLMPSRVAPPPPKHGPSRQSKSPESSMNGSASCLSGEPFSRSLNGFSTLKQPSDHYVLPPRLGAHDPFSSAWDDVGLTAGPAVPQRTHSATPPNIPTTLPAVASAPFLKNSPSPPLNTVPKIPPRPKMANWCQ